jgi:CubicO group peptidase (beta-lactamase class C family)
MHRSYFDGTPYHLRKHRSNNYYVVDGEVRANGLDFDTGITVSNGGWNAPVGDLVRYMSFLVGSLADSDAGGVLARSSLEEMWKPEVDIGDEGGLHQSMGLTFFLLEHQGRTFVGHTGGQKGFISFFYVHPESRTASLAAFNTLGISTDGAPKPDTRRVLADLRERLFDRVFPLFVEAPRNR